MAFVEAFLDKVDLPRLLGQAVGYLPKMGVAAVVLVAFWLGLIMVRRLLNAYFRRAGVPETISDLLLTLLKYAVVALALVTAAAQLDLEVTSLIAGLGIAGLAVSFAAQDTIANIISGITLIIDKPFLVGDWIEANGTHAHVTKVRLRTTVLTTFDNQTIVVPNKIIAQERIINYTLIPRIRVHVPVGVAYKEDINTARQVMLATLRGDKDVLAEPPPDVIVIGLGASSVDLELRFWIEDAALQLPKRWQYLEKCKYALDQAGIEIPFPHLQMFIERSEGLAQVADRLAGT